MEIKGNANRGVKWWTGGITEKQKSARKKQHSESKMPKKWIEKAQQ